MFIQDEPDRCADDDDELAQPGPDAVKVLQSHTVSQAVPGDFYLSKRNGLQSRGLQKTHSDIPASIRTIIPVPVYSKILDTRNRNERRYFAFQFRLNSM